MIRYGNRTNKFALDIDSEYADVLRQAIAEYAESIFALLRKYEYDPKMKRLYITGVRLSSARQGKMIENFGSYDKDRAAGARDEQEVKNDRRIIYAALQGNGQGLRERPPRQDRQNRDHHGRRVHRVVLQDLAELEGARFHYPRGRYVLRADPQRRQERNLR